MRVAQTFPQAFPPYRLRAITGEIELAIAQAAASGRPRAGRVTAVLAMALEEIGGAPATADLVRSLASGSRTWLLQQLAAAFRKADDWFEGRCRTCDAAYDIGVDIAALPVKRPEGSFPEIAVQTSAGRRRFESPNGFHEEAVAVAETAGDARARLIALAGLDGPEDWTDEDLARIEAALEAGAPEASEEAACACPACGEATTARIDPLAFAFPRESDLTVEIHRMASAYHWREADILALPSARRRRYLELIELERRGPRGRPQ